MALIARMTTHESCFRLAWSQHVLEADPDAAVFDGRSKKHLMSLPDPQIAGCVPDDHRAFLNIGNGVLAIDGSAVFGNDQVWPVLACGFHYYDLRAVNRPVCVMSPYPVVPGLSSPGGPPALMKAWPAPVFRIEGNDPAEMFCFDAGVPGQDESFVRLYNEQGWKGLVFDTVWEGSLAELGLTEDTFK